jgi:hypothetical protein
MLSVLTLAPISNVVDPLEETIFLSARLIANSPAAMYALFEEFVVFGKTPGLDVRFIIILFGMMAILRALVCTSGFVLSIYSGLFIII